MKEIEITEKSLELVVSEKTLGSLTTNALQIKALIESALPRYSIDNYNESNIDTAKKDKAMLNNASKVLNARRIEFEKEFLKPFNEFKDVVNETIKLIATCTSKIDTVVKDSEAKEKEAKRSLITNYWKGKEFTLVSLEKIFDDKWLNKGTKEKVIYNEIDSKIAQIKDDIVTLEAIGEDVELLKSIYLESLNVNSTIQYSNTLKKNRETARNSANQTVIQETKSVCEITVPQPKTEPVFEVKPLPTTEEILNRAFRVTGTLSQIIELSNFMNSNGIKFEKIDENA